MKLLIVGGSGFVSGTLCRIALEQGHEVWSLTRGERPLPDAARPLVADRADDAAVEAALGADGTPAHWDLAVDCIGYQASAAEQDLRLLAPRCSQLVFVSTDFVFDPDTRRYPQGEDGAYIDIGRSTYGGGKRAAEEVLLAARDFTAWTVVRPCHIYGPGSRFGCLPLHGRDPELVAKMRRGEPLRLAGGGHFLQQPVLAADLARLILDLAGRDAAHGRIANVAGPEIIESRRYYEIVGELLGVEVTIEEVPVDQTLREHPEWVSFLCHRIYDRGEISRIGAELPATSMIDGLRAMLVAAGEIG